MKVGRNELCPCGSGMKYKKCCLGEGGGGTNIFQPVALEDRPVINGPSSFYEEVQVTKSELIDYATKLYREMQESFSYADESTRPHAFLRLLQKLEDSRVIPSKDIPMFYGSIAINNILEDRLDWAETVINRMDEKGIEVPEEFHIVEGLAQDMEEENFDNLESFCEKALLSEHFDNPNEALIDLVKLSTFFLMNDLPAIALVFARAAFLTKPDPDTYSETLLPVAETCRDDLDLDGEDGPMSKLVEMYLDQEIALIEESQEIQELRKQLKEDQRALKKNQAKLKKAEAELQSIQSAKSKKGHVDSAEKDETIKRQRDKIASLKSLISDKQQQNRDLTSKLENKQSVPDPIDQENELEDDENEVVEPAGAIVMPVFTSRFQKACKTIPRPAVSKALIMAGKFAAQDAGAWSLTKTLYKFDNVYRIKVGRDYRMLIKWQPGICLEILDLIHRQELEKWILQK
jgi:hypothetical protein